jgi:hypothetical protein
MEVERNRMTTLRKQLAEALEIGLEHTQTALSLHEANLGRTTNKNRREAKLLDDEIKQIREALKILGSLSIGRWVSVEERLPEAQGTYRVRWSDDLEDIELNHSFFALGNPHSRQPSRRLSAFTLSRQGANITHWLDLSLPEVGA